MQRVIPQDDATRKAAPMYRGLLGYFPWALFQVAAHSFRSDRKHNPDTPEAEAPHWSRGKSSDHPDCIVRHLAEMHTDPLYHLAAIAWRALAMLQEYGEREYGAAPGVSARFPSTVEKIRGDRGLSARAADAGKYEAFFDGSTVEIDRFAALKGGPDAG